MPAIHSRNDRFQLLQTLLTNRNKRHRAGQFIVQGVRPITLAIEHGWTVDEILYDPSRRPSEWARDVFEACPDAERVKVDPELLSELAEKESVELLAVVRMGDDNLRLIPQRPDLLAVVFDRPSQPGNIGAIVRSADAFGAHAVVTTGHAADAYDPKAVRASTGSFFTLPVLRAPAPADVLERVEEIRAGGVPVMIAATDEHGDARVDEYDLKGPILLAIGNETSGLARAWREAADVTLSIPMTGSASSLNASNAAAVVLYEAHRQRLNAR